MEQFARWTVAQQEIALEIAQWEHGKAQRLARAEERKAPPPAPPATPPDAPDDEDGDESPEAMVEATRAKLEERGLLMTAGGSSV